MKKLLLFIPACIIYVVSIAQQNVGVGTITPSAKLDINGALAMREGAAISLGNGGANGGTNDNIALPHIAGTTDIASFYRVTGPSAVFSVYGIVPATGADGQIVTLINTSGKVMTIVNNNSSNAVNGILTQTGANLVDNAGSTANSSITLQYNKTAGRWYVTGTQNFTVSSGSIATNSSSLAGIVPAGGGNNNKVWGTDGSGNPTWTGVSNSQLANSAITVTPGTGVGVLGSPVSLGGTVTLSNTGVTSITGTNNQVNASSPTGAVTLSLPQNINTAATPTFSAVTVNGANTNDIVASSSIQIGSTTATANGNAGAIQYTGGTLEYSNGSSWLPVTTGGGSNYWTLSGSNLFNNAGTNVGIGTSSPGYTLDLNSGTFGFGASNTRTEQRLDAGLQGNAGAQSGFFQNDGSTVTNYPSGASGWYHLIDCRHSNPVNDYAMQFAGSFFDQNLYFRKTNNNPSQAWSRVMTSNDVSGTTNYVSKFTSANTIGNSQLYDDGTHVGVGTASPSQKLTVNGNATIGNGATYGTGSPGLAIGQNSDFPGNGGWPSGWNSNLLLIGNPDATITFAHETNSLANIRYSNGIFYIGDNAGWGDKILQTPTSTYLGVNGGNVGIGTNTPNARLDVASHTGDGITIGQTIDNTETIQTYIDGQYANRATYAGGCCNALLLQPDVGVVGIGTTAPNGRLDVASNVANNGAKDGIVLYQQQDNTNTIQTYIDGHWGDRTTYASGCCNVLALQPDIGQVSIGTLNPTAKFEINLANPQGWSGNLKANRILAPDNGYYLDLNTYIVAGGNVGYQFSPNGNTGMVITTPGSVGIGTTNPSVTLDVNGSVRIESASDGSGNIRFDAPNPYITASSYIVVPGGAYFNSGTVYTEAQYQCRGGIHNDNGGYLTLAGGSSTDIGTKVSNNVFYVDYNRGGLFGIPDQTNAGAVAICGNMTGGDAEVDILNASPMVGSNRGFRFWNRSSSANNTEILRLQANANLIAIGYSTFSDRNLKTNIQLLSGDLADKIYSLKTYTYNFDSLAMDKARLAHDNKTHFGVMAQELEQLYPNLVDTDSKGIKSVNYMELIPIMVESLKSQNEKIKALQSVADKVTALEEEINKMKAGNK